MILVDTSVWIDFFTNRPSLQAEYLAQVIKQQQELCICGVILTEILQGIKNPREHEQVNDLLSSLGFFDMDKSIFILAADIYRSLRSRGITIRKTLDCMIAAVAIKYKVPLLHHDRDFEPIEKHCGLTTINYKH
jgi:hypothetical protein